MNPPAGTEELHARIVNHVAQIYPDLDTEELGLRLMAAMGLNEQHETPEQHKNHWDEADIAVITYGNSVKHKGEAKLNTLCHFLCKYLQDTVSILHILPFFPYSSDDGFAVTEYTQVNDVLGSWEDIEQLASNFKVMSDLVINHCSGHSRWFEQFMNGEKPGKDYFIKVEPGTDLTEVVRPRTSPLLRKVPTPEGEVLVWCTFSHDQPDLNFRNPDVLLEFIKIIRIYLEHGIKIFRLDAVAFLWKEIGTDCLNLPQTHEIVRLLRTLIEHHTPDAIIITETNIPTRQNLAYFGNANEAHMIYNFSLPPLLLNTLVTGNCRHLKTWMMSMPPAIMGTTYLNFIASHDGIGLRPVEGLLGEDGVNQLISTMENFGGFVSWRDLNHGKNKPYEINISLYDALKGTVANGPDQWQEQRFICAHAIMLALEGIPAFYIHSLFGTENDYQKVKETNNNRGINRHNWELDELEPLLKVDSHHARIFAELKRLIRIRRKQPAFHPNAIHFTLHLGDEVFAFWRQNFTRDQSIFALNNVTDQEQGILLADINLAVTDNWFDLVSGKEIKEDDNLLVLQPYQSVWLSNKLFE